MHNFVEEDESSAWKTETSVWGRWIIWLEKISNLVRHIQDSRIPCFGTHQGLWESYQISINFQTYYKQIWLCSKIYKQQLEKWADRARGKIKEVETQWGILVSCWLKLLLVAVAVAAALYQCWHDPSHCTLKRVTASMLCHYGLLWQKTWHLLW